MKKTIKLLAVLSAVLLLSGCSAKGLSPESTIKAPEPPLLCRRSKALEQAVGKDIVLKYPLVNGRRSAFCSGTSTAAAGRGACLLSAKGRGCGHKNEPALLGQRQMELGSGHRPRGQELLTADTSDL